MWFAGTDRRVLARMLRLLSDDAARLTQGVAALGDTDATLAVLPARLTVTFGFGPGLYRAAGLRLEMWRTDPDALFALSLSGPQP